MAKFEAHITCNRVDSTAVEKVANQVGWSFSAIDGDPILGKGAKCYLTAFDTDSRTLLNRVVYS